MWCIDGGEKIGFRNGSGNKQNETMVSSKEKWEKIVNYIVEYAKTRKEKEKQERG